MVLRCRAISMLGKAGRPSSAPSTRMSGPSMEGVSTVMASPARTAADRPERLALV